MRSENVDGYIEPSAPHYDISGLDVETYSPSLPIAVGRLTCLDKISFVVLWALAAVIVVSLIIAFFMYCA